MKVPVIVLVVFNIEPGETSMNTTRMDVDIRAEWKTQKLVYLPFVKALAQESGANVGVGQGQDLAKEENLDVAWGKCPKAEKEASWDYRWERQYVWSDEGDLSGMQCFFLQRKRSVPSAVLCNMVIYTGFAFVYHHFDGWFGPDLGWDLFTFKRQFSQLSEYWVSLNLFNTPRVWCRDSQ